MPSCKHKQKSDFGHLVWPLAVEQVFMMLIANANVFLLSHYKDQAVAATGLADQVLSIGNMALGIVSLGCTVLFLQNADKAHLDRIRSVFRSGLALNLVFSLALFAASLFFSQQIMGLMQTPAELREAATSYLRIVSLSLVFQGLSANISALLRSFGHVKPAMQVSILTSILVVTGNALVILTPFGFLGGGVRGVAMSTVMTRAGGALVGLVAIRRFLPDIWDHMGLPNQKDLALSKEILKLGIPSGMENVSYNFSQTIITGMIASLGTVALTSKIYSQTITAIIFTLSVAVGQAGQIMVGRYLRSDRYQAATQFGKKNARTYVLTAMVMGLFLALLGKPLIGLFTTDPQITKTVRILLWLSILYDPMRSANEILIAQLQVTGDVRYPVAIGMATTYLLTLPAIFFLTRFLKQGILAVWLVFILDEALRAGLFYQRWSQGQWMKDTWKEREKDRINEKTCES